MHDTPDVPGESGLTHFDDTGAAHMVDVGAKAETKRVAIASALVRMSEETATVIREGRAGKGDVLGVARIAGIMAAKRTSELIPLCHPLPITHVAIELECDGNAVAITARVETHGQTGVEMEALTAASVTALTIYDMCKAIDRGMTIERIQLEVKDGGKSGRWDRSQQ